MELHKDREVYLELIYLTRKHFGYPESQIEKDYWITKLLKDLNSNDFEGNIFFKGGTSLSKAYHIIDRFSEDLDIFVTKGGIDRPDYTYGQEKGLNRKIYKYIESKHKERLKENLCTRGGNYNKAVINYEPAFSNNELKEYLEIEIKSCSLKNTAAAYYPSDKKYIQSLIGQCLEQKNRNDIIRRYGLERFEVNCLNPKKTICDKVSRIARLSYGNNPNPV